MSKWTLRWPLARRKPTGPALIGPDWRFEVTATVWDVFPYWKERWAVEARQRLWAEHAPTVTYRPIACVGDRTFRGNPLPDDLPPSGVEEVTVELDGKDAWAREHQQRNGVLQLLSRMQPNDLILLTDADEIVDPRVLPVIAAMTAAGPIKLGMPLYMLGTRFRNPRWWTHPAACRVRDLPGDPSEKLRSRFDLPVLLAAGWHLTYQGTDEDVDAKLKAFSHDEWDTAEKRAELTRLRSQGTGMVDEPLAGPLIVAGKPPSFWDLCMAAGRIQAAETNAAIRKLMETK